MPMGGVFLQFKVVQLIVRWWQQNLVDKGGDTVNVLLYFSGLQWQDGGLKVVTHGKAYSGKVGARLVVDESSSMLNL